MSELFEQAIESDRKRFGILTDAERKQTTSWTPVVHKTRFTELGFCHLFDFWQCVDLTGDRPAQVGYQYATKDELLANLEAYATEYGCEGANPKPVLPKPELTLDYLRAHGFAVVVFTPQELEGVNPNRVVHRLVELGLEVIAGLKPESPAAPSEDCPDCGGAKDVDKPCPFCFDVEPITTGDEGKKTNAE
jgi:hypothetical protein